MDYKKVAQEIVKGIGGSDNASYLEHCSTRLRFKLNDDAKADLAYLEKIDGVMGVRQNAQTQIIIGNEVNEVYAEVQKLLGSTAPAGESKRRLKDINIGQEFLDYLVGIFQPIVPAIAGGGVLKSLLLLFSMFGWLDKTGSTYQILTLVGDAPLYFLPLLVAITTARKLNVNQLVAAAAAGSLLLPGMTALITEGTTLFSFNVQNIAYSYQVFPAILTVLFYGLLENFFTKYTPKAIRIFFVPMISLVIAVPVGLLILGPIGYQIGVVISAIIMFLYNNFGWLATGVLAASLPFMVATGMHKAMLPYAISTMTSIGKELLYLPASLAHNISEAGACFGVAIRTKDANKRSTAISAGISALFGITEPALYGVTIQNSRVLASVVIGSLVGGLFIGITAVEAFALVGPGLASITMYANPDNSMNLIWAIAGFVISLVVSFAASLILYRDDVEVVEEPTKQSAAASELNLSSPVEGKLISLTDVQDEVFSSGLMGPGFANIPSKGELYSPIDGEVKMVFNTNHALGLVSPQGIEFLFHIGIDTVQLKGEHFKPLVKEGDRVTKGQPLITFDLEAIKAAGYDTTTITIVQKSDAYTLQIMDNISNVTTNDTVAVLRNGVNV